MEANPCYSPMVNSSCCFVRICGFSWGSSSGKSAQFACFVIAQAANLEFITAARPRDGDIPRVVLLAHIPGIIRVQDEGLKGGTHREGAVVGDLAPPVKAFQAHGVGVEANALTCRDSSTRPLSRRLQNTSNPSIISWILLLTNT